MSSSNWPINAVCDSSSSFGGRGGGGASSSFGGAYLNLSYFMIIVCVIEGLKGVVEKKRFFL